MPKTSGVPTCCERNCCGSVSVWSRRPVVVSCSQALPHVALSRRVPSGEKHWEESQMPIRNSSGVSVQPVSEMRTTV